MDDIVTKGYVVYADKFKMFEFISALGEFQKIELTVIEFFGKTVWKARFSGCPRAKLVAEGLAKLGLNYIIFKGE